MMIHIMNVKILIRTNEYTNIHKTPKNIDANKNTMDKIQTVSELKAFCLIIFFSIFTR